MIHTDFIHYHLLLAPVKEFHSHNAPWQGSDVFSLRLDSSNRPSRRSVVVVVDV